MTVGEAFPASARVRKRADFQRIQRDGRPFRTPHFILLVHPGEPELRRLGLVATKKLGSAPVRNRGKRLCREVFRRTEPIVPTGFDCVVILRAGAHELSFDAVRAEWDKVRTAIARHCKRDCKGVQKPGGKGSGEVETRPERPHLAARRPS